MQRFMSEFREFAARGSVMDLAVGIIIGIAFGKVVESAVNDFIMPILAALLGRGDFSSLFIPLLSPPAVPPTLEALRKAGVPIISYGNFLLVTLNFLLLAVVVFVVVRWINRLNRRTAPALPEEIVLLREIRDAMNRP